MFKNLLIADYGKSHVEDMVKMLRDLPQLRQARLNLLHVITEQGGERADENSKNAEMLVLSMTQRLGIDPSEINTIIRQGDIKQTVLKVADELDADLIVMGSRGLGRLQSILSNSASQYVFQLSTRPMLLVREGLYVRHLNRILVAIDGTGVGEDALRIACEIAQDIPNSTLTGVYVSRQEVIPSKGNKSPANDIISKAVQRARGLGVNLNTIQCTGDVGRGVCQVAEEIKADLVVIASQDRRPLIARALVDLDRLLGSSVSDYVRVHAPAPVLLVREPERRQTA
ncbi:hypothetical protein PMYN1_Chma575 (chromatophore) [Paulinella micropora]|uniref:UspA domain-containing protein n=1 Tax=Paulinella micropora TaxID=1928728 RepID=A0A1L5YCH2_9EUKA|nr:hypothetical protein PCKR_625 [Paulinella micropora]AQX45166.1 hypothetical protein PFK_625 [Paulinella micropora]BBL86383.1 hypothetical protein PMYN1_Chma575 [Paulinella micropora]